MKHKERLDVLLVEKGYLEEVVAFPFEMIQNPNITNNEFDSRSFNIIKNRLKADIESLKEKATRYAYRRSLINMDSSSPTSYSMLGTLEDLDNSYRYKKNAVDG